MLLTNLQKKLYRPLRMFPLSSVALATLLALQGLTPCHAKEHVQAKPDNILGDFLKDMRPSSDALNQWYSNYTVRPPAPTSGSLYDTTKDLSLSDVTLQVTGKVSNLSGAGVALHDLTLENMRSTIFFKNNIALANGGAIYTTNTCSLINNHVPICFDHNLCRESGGAIYARNTLRLEDNTQPIYFLENTGAAIRSGQIILKNCGPMIFLGNLGCGVYCEGLDPNTPSFCDFSADNADILFYRNTLLIGGRKALQTSRNSESKLYLGARKGYAIRFYDPIDMLSPSSTPQEPSIIFNRDDAQRGSIVFSSMDVSDHELFDSSRHSHLAQPCLLKYGVTCVTDKAGLFVYQLTQTRDGLLCLGNAAVLSTYQQAVASGQTSSTAGCNLAISNLALDLVSISKPGALPPRIWVAPVYNSQTQVFEPDTNPVITLSGGLNFLDMWGNDPYDSMDLSKPITNQPLLCLWDNDPNPQITRTDFDLEAANTQPHYGYQGTWTFTWIDQLPPFSDNTSMYGLNPTRTLLCGTWRPRDYIHNPKYDAPLIANSLWESIYTLIPGMTHTLSSNPTTALSGQLIGMVHVQKTQDDVPGFHLRTKGYWTGVSSRQGCEGQLFTINFGQSFSRMTEKLSNNRVSSKHVGTTLKVDTPLCHGLWHLSVCLGYTYGSHDSFYSYSYNKKATGEFMTNTLGFSARCFQMTPECPRFLQVTPFLEARFFQSLLSSFTETADLETDVRHFSSAHPFWDFTTPIGILITPKPNLPESLPCRYPNWSCTLTYSPTWIRRSPSAWIQKVASKGAWASSGTRVSRHALAINVSSETQLFPRFKTICSYEGSVSTTTICNYMTMKGSLDF